MLAKVFLATLVISAVTATHHGGYEYAPSYGYHGSYSEPDLSYDNHPQPYSFGYETKDAYGNKQFRQEDSDASGAKKGSYGYTDAHGIYRTVEYVADKNGFRAWIKTNEPGTANQDPADVKVNAVEPPVVHHTSHGSAPAYYKTPVDHYEPVIAYKEPISYKAPVASYKAPIIYKAPVSYKVPVSYKAPVYGYASSPKVYKMPAYGYKPHYRKYDDLY